MQATAKKAVKIPLNRIDEVLEYLSLVDAEQAENVLNMIAERVGKKRQQSVQLTLIKNEEATPSEPTGQLNVVETPQVVEKLETELKENRAELGNVQDKLEQVQALIVEFKAKAHKTSPRWQHARTLLNELDKLINDNSNEREKL